MLGDNVDIVMGQSPKGEFVNEAGRGFPLLNGPTEFGANHPVPTQFTEKGVRFAETGDLLFCVRGSTTGRMNWADQRYAIGRGIAAIRHLSDQRLQPLVRGLIEGQLPTLLAAATGSTFPNVTGKMIASLSYSELTHTEQLEAAITLGQIADKIKLNRRMNETLEEMARALFRDWFVDFGPTRRQMEGATDPAAIMGHAFPPEKAATLASLFPVTLGDDGLPEGWEKRVLHDLTDWVNGAAYKNMHFSLEPDALPVIKIAELKAGVTKNTKHTNTALGEKYRITDGEVLFSWSGNPDTSIDTFIWSGGEGWLNQHIFAVRPNGEVPQSVLYFLLKYLRPQFAEIARDKQTTGLGHVTKQDLRSMRVCLGTDELLGHLTSSLEPFFQKIYANQLENRTLAQMRDLLLPKLMSGEIRLSDLEAVS